MKPSILKLAGIGAATALISLIPAVEAAAQVRGAGRTSVSRDHSRAAHAGSPNRDADRGGNANRSRDANANRDVNRDRNVNRDVNRDINRDIDVDVDVDHDWDWDDRDYYPVAAGVAFGTAAAVTSAVIGSMTYSLPYGCSPYGGYYSCGGVYYQPQYQGDTVVYVVVDDPD